MKFEEIFKEEGLYGAESFREGIALEIKRNEITGDNEVFMKSYKDKNDVMPETTSLVVYEGLFKKDYIKIYTRQSLFL